MAEKAESSTRESHSETLSVLLKRYEDTQTQCREELDHVETLICESRIKSNWKKKYIKTGNSKTELEYAAYNAANYLEALTKRLTQTMTEIEGDKEQAKEFAKNCFSYLNKVHEGTCIGEAGKIILDLFEKGKLCTQMMDAIMTKAEEICKKRQIPFARKLNQNQKKAIEFMVEEKELRVSPVINELQNYVNLRSHLSKWVPLLEALVEENEKKAQKIVDTMP